VDADGGPLANAPVPRIALDDDHYLPSARLSEQVIGIPSGADGSITLQTTIFKPEGPGPFPMVVFNHGKMHGDPRMQSRSDPVSFAREFVRRGYVVVAPNRQGFAQSGGTYVQDGCDVERNGMSQAADVAATVEYMSQQPYVDAQHIVIAGTSHGSGARRARADQFLRRPASGCLHRLARQSDPRVRHLWRKGPRTVAVDVRR
jgi:hypothetical protein